MRAQFESARRWLSFTHNARYIGGQLGQVREQQERFRNQITRDDENRSELGAVIHIQGSYSLHELLPEFSQRFVVRKGSVQCRSGAASWAYADCQRYC